VNAEEIRAYCLAKNGVEEDFPFDEVTLVFKVGGKMFVLMSLDSEPLQFNAKCDPSDAEDLREQYSWIQPGYHMNKKHWNTISCDSTASKKLVFKLIDDSYELVVKSLPRKVQQQLNNKF
jgi:predicted DNA-binding protein (MmcQ/YjbR family)